MIMLFRLFGRAQCGGSELNSAKASAISSTNHIEAEALGFLCTFAAEHHFTEFGQLSAMLNLLSRHPLFRSLSVLSYQLAAHGDLMVPAPAQNFPMVRRSEWHTKGSTKHFDS
jgi:hypothetical protein